MDGTLYATGRPEIDGLLNSDPNARLIGILLEQQITMETAFADPAKMPDRLGHLDPLMIAEPDQEEFTTIFAERPAIHRFTSSMGARLQDLCDVLAERFDDDAAEIWSDVSIGDEPLVPISSLPGFGEESSKIFIVLLAKTQGARPNDWQEAADEFRDGSPRSVADVFDPESLNVALRYSAT
jgi:uncharacterized HhH-GPD family protein